MSRRIRAYEHLRVATVERDGFSLELVEIDGSQAPRQLVPGIDNPAMIQGFGKLAFTVRNLDEWVRRLRQLGARFVREPSEDAAHRSRWLIVLDERGNWLQFSAPDDAASR